jgi:hypothetical protein
MTHLEFYDAAEYEPDEPRILSFLNAISVMQQLLASGQIHMANSAIGGMVSLGGSLEAPERDLYLKVLHDTLGPMYEEAFQEYSRIVNPLQKLNEILYEPPSKTGPKQDPFARRGKGVKRR